MARGLYQTDSAESEPSKAEPVAWLWEYIGKDPMRQHIYPVARALYEMDPHNNPYPDSWAPIAPLYAAPPSAQTGAQDHIAQASKMVTQSTYPHDVSKSAGEIDMAQERAAFEKWVDAHVPEIPGNTSRHRQRQIARQAWQAALAAPAQLSDAQIEQIALENGLRKSSEHWGDRYYTELGQHLFQFARALLSAAQGKEIE